MATVNFRVDEALKEKSYSILKEQGIAPTDLFLSMLLRLGNYLSKKLCFQKKMKNY